MTRVYLVRHGIHDLVGKTLVGRMPGVHLGPEGLAQADRVAAALASRGVRTLLSSPMERCRETAAPIAARLGLPVETDQALTEVDYGEWTGRSIVSLSGEPAWRRWNDQRLAGAVPHGEPIQAVQARGMGVVERYATGQQGSIVLVSHGDVIKAIALTLIGASLDRHDRLAIDPASITTVDLWPGGGKVVRSNEVVPA